MSPVGPALGVDFGTSNSAVGYLADGVPRLVEMAPGQLTLPTAFFFDFDLRKTHIGAPAVDALLNGDHGRFMRALKRVLGTGLMHEKRQILNERVTFVDVIGRFLSHMKAKAEDAAGKSFSRVVAGRPVVFHGENDPREAIAEADLRACFHAAGFDDIHFMAEPEAAALAAGAANLSDELGLIVDIGGGTSDFSVFRRSAGEVEVLSNRGVRIGGTDFDKALSADHVMPLLGKGSRLRDTFGAGTSVAPHAVFQKLATWEDIPFLYTAGAMRLAKDMHRQAAEPQKFARLVSVLENELGHDIAFAVEAGKIAANSGAASGCVDLKDVERNLAVDLSAVEIAASLMDFGPMLRAGALAAMQDAGAPPAQVSHVVYVGGSSKMTLVTETMRAAFPGATHQFKDVFTAVVDGLTLATARLEG